MPNIINSGVARGVTTSPRGPGALCSPSRQRSLHLKIMGMQHHGWRYDQKQKQERGTGGYEPLPACQAKHQGQSKDRENHLRIDDEGHMLKPTQFGLKSRSTTIAVGDVASLQAPPR